MGDDAEERKRFLCWLCNLLTNQVLRGRCIVREEITLPEYWEDGANFNGIEPARDAEVPSHLWRFSIWQCPGCNSPTVEWEMGDEYTDGRIEWSHRSYDPKRSLEPLNSLSIRQFKKLKPELQRLYDQTIGCFNRGEFLLCSIGLRTMIEGVCVDKGIDQKLVSEGRRRPIPLGAMIPELIHFLPSPNIIEALRYIKDAGNDAAHYLEEVPTREELEQTIHVVEDILNFLYELDYRAEQISLTSKREVLKSFKTKSVQ